MQKSWNTFMDASKHIPFVEDEIYPSLNPKSNYSNFGRQETSKFGWKLVHSNCGRQETFKFGCQN